MTYRALMILGPTASGKTALALELARRHPVEIISIDSALIYRGMDIGSAKPTKEELAICPHHLIDIRDINESYSAADFREDALRLIGEITARGRFPLIVGGTMLYAKALREGMDELPAADATVRKRVAKEAAAVGWPTMHAKLAAVDPVSGAKLKPNDSQRIGRALEVFYQTGRPMSSLQTGVRPVDETIGVLGLVPGNRAVLHQAIGERFDAMLQIGFMDEMKRLVADPRFDRESPAMRCVGYRQAAEFLAGEVDYATFVEKAKAATRQLAKRQMTWLRSMPEITVVDSLAMTKDELVAAAEVFFSTDQRGKTKPTKNIA